VLLIGAHCDMTNNHEHITRVLVEQQWLPVTARIAFKLALRTFRILTNHQPSYIHAELENSVIF